MSRILEKYVDLFPPSLFFCSDDIHSMHFVLSLKHMSHINQDELVDLMKHCGAELSFNLEDVSDHSAVIVDHDEVVNVKAPAFTLSYIEDCLRNLKVLNISDYRQDITRHIAKDFQCMDVVYFRKRSWESILTETEKQWFADKVNSSKLTERFVPLGTPSVNDVLSLVSGRLKASQQEDILQLEKDNSKTVNEHKLSSDEDSDLEDIYKYRDIGDTANQVTENITQKRAKSNEKNLNKKSGDLKSTTESSNSSVPNSIAASVPPGTSKWAFLDEFQSESSDEECSQIKEIESKKKKKCFFDSDKGSERLFTAKDNKHSRLPYSYEEQSRILNYIKDHCEYSRVKGRDLWIIMERRKICPHRTWQSMKEHFLKKIALNLEAFDFLTKSEKMKIKQALC